jgi:hypothetical protein
MQFSDPQIPIAEIAEFYSLKDVKAPNSSRPYAWSNSVTSLDGILHFQGDSKAVE